MWVAPPHQDPFPHHQGARWRGQPPPTQTLLGGSSWAVLCLHLLMASAVQLVDRRGGTGHGGAGCSRVPWGWQGRLSSPGKARLWQDAAESPQFEGPGWGGTPHPSLLAGTHVPPWASMDEDQGLSQAVTSAGVCPLVVSQTEEPETWTGVPGQVQTPRPVVSGGCPGTWGVSVWAGGTQAGAEAMVVDHGLRPFRPQATVPSWQVHFVWENQCLGTGGGERPAP